MNDDIVRPLLTDRKTDRNGDRQHWKTTESKRKKIRLKVVRSRTDRRHRWWWTDRWMSCALICLSSRPVIDHR